MLGRFQPWHEGHTALFERAISKTGQVVILLRDTEIDDNNPYSAVQRTELIKVELENEGYIYGNENLIRNKQDAFENKSNNRLQL